MSGLARAARVSAPRPAPATHPLRLVRSPSEPDGTSRLDQVARAASDAGCLVRRATPAPAERVLEFGVMRALLEAPLRHMPEAHRRALLDGAAGPAARLLLGPARADEDATPDIVVAHSFLWLAAGIGTGRGLALIVDDAQWSDAASIEVLAYLTRRIDDVPVLLAVAAGAGAGLPDNLCAAVRQRVRSHRRAKGERALRAAELMVAEGCFEEAYAAACEAGAGEEQTGWRSIAAVALAYLGRHAEAIALAETDLPLARAGHAPEAIARALLARVVAEPDQATRAELAARALQELADRPAGLESVRLRVELGSALARIGRRTEAREPLRQALADADRAGAVRLAERARRELVATGLRPRRAALRGAGALTPRQREICELAAAGKGNPSIANELFLSIKTVETHLAAAYRKLGVRTRGELTGALGRP